MPLYEFDGKSPLVPADGSAWVAPSADLIGEVHVQPGASIWFGAVIRADNTPITIGAGANIQEGAMLHSDPGSPLSVGDDVTVGHHGMGDGRHGFSLEVPRERLRMAAGGMAQVGILIGPFDSDHVIATPVVAP